MSNEARAEISILNDKYVKDSLDILARISAGKFERTSDGFTAQEQLRAKHFASVMAVHRRYAAANAGI